MSHGKPHLLLGDPPVIDRRAAHSRLVGQHYQEFLVRDQRSTQNDGSRPASLLESSKADAFQENGEGASFGERIAGQTHLSDLSKAPAGSATNDGTVCQPNAMDFGDMPGDCLLRSSGGAGGPSDLQPRLGSGPGIRTGIRRGSWSPGSEEKIGQGATRAMHKSTSGYIAGVSASMDPGSGPGGQPPLHGQGEPGGSLPLLPAALPEDFADSSGASSECSRLQSEVICNPSDGEHGGEDVHDSVENGPETCQWDIDAEGWDFSGHQRRCA